MERMRVLIGEHQESVRTNVVAHLSAEFDLVDVVDDGEQLVKAAILHSPEVIVSDIVLPLLDGLLARKQLLSKGIHVPFVFVTMFHMARVLPSNLDECAVGVVHRVDLPVELKVAIRSVAFGHPYLSRSFRRNAD